MSYVVAPIVEGHGDVAAVRVLIARLAPQLRVARPVRMPRQRLVLPEHLSRAAQIARANILDRGALLLMLDADEDCAASLGPKLQATLMKSVSGCLCRVVLPVREFEAWIVGGTAGFSVDNPDSAGNPKRRIREACNGVYSETADQARLTATADLVRLHAVSRSFRKFEKVIAELSDDANSRTEM